MTEELIDFTKSKYDEQGENLHFPLSEEKRQELREKVLKIPREDRQEFKGCFIFTGKPESQEDKKFFDIWMGRLRI